SRAGGNPAIARSSATSPPTSWPRTESPPPPPRPRCRRRLRNRPCHRSDSFQGRAQGGLSAVHNGRQAGGRQKLVRPVHHLLPLACGNSSFARLVPIARLPVTRTSSYSGNASEHRSLAAKKSTPLSSTASSPANLWGSGASHR